MSWLISLLILCVTLGAQSTYYVDYVGGDDSNAGTEALPWKTSSKIGSGSTTNDTVLLKGGVTLVCGATPIVLDSGQTLGAYGSGIPIVSAATTVHCVQLDSTTGVTIKDVKLTHSSAADASTGACIQASTSCNNLTVRGVTLYGGFAGFNCGNGITGTGNAFYGCFFELQWTDGIDVRGTLDIVAYNCTFWRCGVPGDVGASVNGPGDAISSHQTGTFTATECRIFSGARSAGLSVHTAGTCTYTRCFVETDDETDASGRYVFGMDGTGTMVVTNCVVLVTGTVEQYVFRSRNGGIMTVSHNTVLVTNTHATTTVLLGTGASSSVMTAKNNLIYAYAAGTTRLASSVEAGSLVSDYNCYFPTTGNRWGIIGVFSTFAVWQAATRDTNGIAADPLVYNATSPTTVTDARLTAGSPCRGAGVDLSITVDIRNRGRGGFFDIGAWGRFFP